jgi:putative oxidoreductase
MMKKLIFGTPVSGLMPSIGLFLFRIAFGLFMLFGHGWGKMMTFSEKAGAFPDPLGMGNELSMAAAIFAEVACAALVVLGLATRIAVLPLIFTMIVAAFIVHGGNPFSSQEPALVYLAAFALLFFTGAGSLSLDRVLGKKG